MQAIADGVPSIRSPLPLLLILPELVLAGEFGVPPELSALIPMTTFCLFGIPVIGRQRIGINRAFPILLTVLSSLDICFLVAGWQYGLQYEGEQFTVWVTVANVVCIAALWSMWLAWRRAATFGHRVAILSAMHCWLFWCAFPWLGELL